MELQLTPEQMQVLERVVKHELVDHHYRLSIQQTNLDRFDADEYKLLMNILGLLQMPAKCTKCGQLLPAYPGDAR